MMRRIDMLRKHDEEDQFRKTKMVGHCDPQVMEREDGTWWLHHLDFPTADHVWFVCDPRGQPFPFSYGYTKVKAITGFLALLNLPDRQASRVAAFCRHTDQPERGKWWGWFKRQGYTVQNFEVNPKREDMSLAQFLRYEVRWANKHTDGCVWCKGVQRFQNIAARIALMVEAIEYYSQRPEEQQRWLATMNKLWDARGRR
jgi:phage terminase large subunit-like protein